MYSRLSECSSNLGGTRVQERLLEENPDKQVPLVPKVDRSEKCAAQKQSLRTYRWESCASVL